MGIGRGAVKLLMEEGLKRPFEGKILTLGRQDVWICLKDLHALAKETNYPLKNCPVELSHKQEMSDEGYISDRMLAHALGFSELVSLDYSDYEKADFIADLNQPISTELRNEFDLIFDGGTLEHVFHLPQALKNIYQMLKLGGRIVHLSPSSNHVDHGFYMFSPTLFFDYYQINRFEIHRLLFIRHAPQGMIPWQIKEYTPGCLNGVSYGGLDGAMYAIGCIATKSPDSTEGLIPQQRNYLVGGWAKTPLHPVSGGILTWMKKAIKKNVFIYRIFAAVKNSWLFKKKGLGVRF